MTQKLLRMNEVTKTVGLSRSTIYALCSKGQFPKQVQITERTVGWLDTEIDEWVVRKATARTIH